MTIALLGSIWLFWQSATISSAQATPFIVNGSETGYERWRGVINLYNHGPGCTGALIGPRVAMTAAHCTPGFITNPTQVTIVGGADLTDPTQIITYSHVIDVAIAPDSPGRDIQWMRDIALLYLDEPITAAPHYALYRGPRARFGSSLTIVGYGTTAYQRADHGMAREGSVEIANPFPGDPEGNRYSLYFSGPSTVCSGDSGAPMFFRDADQWFIAAVAAASTYCQPEKTGYATYVPAYYEWISNTYTKWTGTTPPSRGAGPAERRPPRFFLPFVHRNA